ncbi:MAG: Rv0804 family intramembrane glutamic endopeptidase [Mycobacterium sp.]
MSARLAAVSLAAGVLVWSYAVGPRLGELWRPPVHAALAVAAVRVTRADPVLRPPAVWQGVCWGIAAAAVTTAGVAATTASPRVRAAMAERETPLPAGQWLAYRIPFGTVVPEEVVFRVALRDCAAEAFGPVGGRWLQAAAFGLSHIADARAAGEPVVGTVLVAGAAGWVFGWLADRSGSVVAPMLAHLAINEAGAIAALSVRNRRSPT